MRKITKQARRLTVLTVWMVIGGFALQAQTASPGWVYSTSQMGKPSNPRLIERYAQRLLAFEANHGQVDSRVKFLSRASGYDLFLAPDEAVLSLRKTGAPSRVLRLRWLGADRAPRISGRQELPGKVHYLKGNAQAGWRRNVPAYGQVSYERVYPGTDLVFYGNEGELEYDFVLAPGADPRVLRLAVEGADRIAVDPSGDLVIKLGSEEVRLKRPVAYQEIGGARREVASRYRLDRKGSEIGFAITSWDRSHPLVIDPVLVYSTYLGGFRYDEPLAIAADPTGSAYVTGYTNSPDFPIRGAIQPDLDGYDAFVTKIGPDGMLIYSTYFGGTGEDIGRGIVVDAAGNAYLTGETRSTDFPRVNPLPAGDEGESYDAFVAKLDPSGASLVYSTRLGGNAFDGGYDIDIDLQGNAYVVGNTFSPDFPTVNPLQSSSQGFTAFVAKLAPGGSSLTYSTYLTGDRLGATANGIAVDSAGHAWVAGTTQSPNFPTVNAFQPSLASFQDAFIVELHPSGSSLIFASLLGGSGTEFTADVAVDTAGNAYVTGYTDSGDFPVQNALQPNLAGYTDAFITKVNAGGALVYSTYFGGSYLDGAVAVAVDAAGNTFLAGFTGSIDFPLANPIDTHCDSPNIPLRSCGDETFLSELSPGGSLEFSTYLGGLGGDYGRGVAAGPGGVAYVTGITSARDFPTRNALQAAFSGEFDGFVAKVQLNRSPDCAVSTASQATLWPPNGRLVPVSILGVTDPDGDPVTLTVTGVHQDEPLSRTGTPDAMGIGTAGVSVRADRDGKGDGRVYHVAFEASDGNGGVCTGTVTVCVPHDQGRGRTCGDGDGLFDSTGSGR